MSRFCIVLAEQPHRQVFAEVVEMLSWGLSELAHEVEFATEPRQGVRNIVLAPHLLLASHEDIRLEPGTIVYNSEPHVSPLFARSMRLLAQPGIVAWDYSARNIEFLHALSVPARHVPYAWVPSLTRGSHFEDRSVDVLFIGSISPRRKRVLDDLTTNYPDLKVRWLFGVYGPERDHMLVRSRVCLNMHYWEERPPNEDLRIVLACANSVAVVSEGQPDEAIKANWAIWCPYGELAWTAAKAIRSDRWRHQASWGFASVRMRDFAVVLKEALEGEGS